jgi:hypothetical protein
VQATALMRDYRAQDMAFEIVDMTLDERTKYRRLLADNHSPARSVEDKKSQSPAIETSPTP